MMIILENSVTTKTIDLLTTGSSANNTSKSLACGFRALKILIDILHFTPHPWVLSDTFRTVIHKFNKIFTMNETQNIYLIVEYE